MTRQHFRSLTFAAAALLTSCDTTTQRKPACGRDTIIAVAPVGGGDGVRKVHLTPVCKEES